MAVAAAACLVVVLTVLVAFISILGSRGKAIIARNDAQTAQKQAEVSEKAAVVARNDALRLAEQNKELADQENSARKKAEAATISESAQRKRADEEAQAARRSADVANRERLVADQRLYVATMNLAQLALDNGHSARLQDLLARYSEPAPGQDDPRGWEWYYLKSQSGQQLRTLPGHDHDVAFVAVSPDGSIIASGSNTEFEPVAFPFGKQPPPKVLRKGNIKLWNTKTGAEFRTFGQHEHTVRGLAFTPDGKRLISSDFQKLHIWEVATGRELPTKYDGQASAIAMRPDGKRLAIVDNDNLRIWDLEKDEEVKRFAVVPANLKRKISSARLAYSPDGTSLAGVVHLQPDFEALRDPQRRLKDFADRKPDCLAILWNPETGEAPTQIWGAGEYVVFSPEGNRIVTGFTTEAHIVASQVRVWEVSTGKAAVEPQQSAGPTFATAAFAPNGKTFCVSAGANIQVYDAVTGKVTTTLRGHKGTILSMAFSADGRYLVSAGNDNVIKIWTISGAEAFATLDVPATDVAVDGAQTLLVLANTDGKLQLWQLDQLKKIKEISIPFQWFRLLALSPDATRIAARNQHLATTVYSANEGKSVMSLPGQGEGSTSATLGGPAWSSDGKWIAAPVLGFSVGDSVKVWNSTTGKPHFNVPNARFVAFSSDSRQIVTGGRSESFAVWDFLAGRQVFTKRLNGADGRVEGPTCVAYSPDGKTVAAGFYSGRIALFSAKTGDQLLAMEGHANEVNRLIYTPDSRRLISASDDTTIKLWDTTTGMETFTLRGHSTGVWAISMSADGRWLVSAGGGGVHLRDIGRALPNIVP